MNREDQLLNRSEIIRMAREADREWDCDRDMVEWLEWFAALIASRVAAKASAAAKAEEREACANVCDEYSAVGKIEEFDRGWLACAKAISNVIRARGETSSRSDT